MGLHDLCQVITAFRDAAVSESKLGQRQLLAFWKFDLFVLCVLQYQRSGEDCGARSSTSS